ncbi:MAG: hypothetical protein ACKVOP_00785 [Sphingomonadaceae bacterium]
MSNEMNDQTKSAPADTMYSFEEYRMMYDSTELVSDRKIAFTRANYSLCLAIIAGQGFVASWVYGKGKIEIIGCVFLLLISLLALMFCRYWYAQLISFKRLNSAKFQVLEEMAKDLVFPDYREMSIRSISPFQREYEILEKQKKLKNYKGMKVLSSNSDEMIVPLTFQIFFYVSGGFFLLWGISAATKFL